MLVGPADDVAQILQELPRALEGTGLSLQPQKTQLWAPDGDQILQHPHLKQIQTQMKDPRGLIILGEALGEDPTDPYPMGNEAFILDHLQDVTKAVVSDLDKIAVLPDRLEGDTAGLQVAWALISKNFATPGGPFTESPPGGNKPKRCATPCKMPSLTLSDSYLANLASMLTSFSWPNYQSQQEDWVSQTSRRWHW